MTTPSSPSASPMPLEDVQARPDERAVALHAAGVSHVKMPLTLVQKDGNQQRVTATVAMTVDVPATQKGTHMSRFVIQLNEWSRGKVFSLYLNEFLLELAQRLESNTAAIDLSFDYFVEKQAPVTQASAPMAYPCRLVAQVTDAKTQAPQFKTRMQVQAAIATLCPCSKAISDFGAHNQRALITTDVMLSPNPDNRPLLWIEDLVALSDEAASCPVYPLLKRADEKWVTERQYNNPKFVEDVCRDASVALRQHQAVAGFRVRVEALESIHEHNAYAAYAEGDAMLNLC
jgi:GTP cyclohydrolase IB